MTPVDAVSVRAPAAPRTVVGLPPAVISLASTHFIVDAYNNIYTPLLPLFIPQLGLSLTAVGTLAMCFQMASSVSQLGFGALADRWRPRVLLIAGPILTVVVLSLVGLAPSTLTLGALLVVGGLGGAAFHPPAAAAVFRASGANKGFAMSVHITGGSVGMAMAPLVLRADHRTARSALVADHRHALAWLALWMLLRRVPPLERQPGSRTRGLRRAAAVRQAAHAALFLGRAAHADLGRLLPPSCRCCSPRRACRSRNASLASTCYLLVSGIGGFAGGTLADRFGPRRVILTSLVSAVPFMVLPRSSRAGGSLPPCR